ncbi:aminoglycoside phosphotransferase [Sphaerisporangium sp. NPDC051011]|uniref:aminoglycoside phosphotransferase n=1 Tax=Sphaerisporangium sp. NPDC051011 TaxID=3155792 RepID=UPI0033C4BB0D
MTSRHRRLESGQRAFLRRVLSDGATRLGVSLIGQSVFGWHDRTIGSAALRAGGGRFWLRATAEHRDFADGDTWTGNHDANRITGVPRPEVMARAEWDEPPVVMYAELMTYVPDAPCSSTPELTEWLTLPSTWWIELRQALDTLAVQPTSRGCHDPRSFVRRVEDYYGRRLGPHTPTLQTEHTDLHWANLTKPGLWLLDWEYWGAAPAGYGAALLYCHSLLVPGMAARVHEVFADLLDTPTGFVAQLSAAAHILDRAERLGDYRDLRIPAQEHALRLLSAGGGEPC